MTLAWHFLAESGKLRDGRPAPADGVWLEHEGEIRICSSGLHASRHVSDAVKYAPGPIVCRVEVDGDILHESDKLVGRRRRILWRADATQALRDHARFCARQVLHLWDAPEVVREFLRTGDESLLADAWSASSGPGGVTRAARAARAAAKAARAAAGDAARDAARDAAWNAAWDAAWASQRRDLSRRIRALEGGRS